MKRGDRVETPRGKTGTVASVGREGGEAVAYVRMDDAYQGERTYEQAKLKITRKGDDG